MKEIQSSIIFDSNFNNQYLFDSKERAIFLLHPVLFFILSLIRQGVDIDIWMHQLSENKIQIEGYGEVLKTELAYYYRKYQFFKRKGIFASSNRNSAGRKILTPSAVEKALANTRQVTFEVTERCNLKCEYCGFGKFYNNYETRENQDMSIKIVEKALLYLSRLWNSPRNNSRESRIVLGFYGG